MHTFAFYFRFLGTEACNVDSPWNFHLFIAFLFNRLIVFPHFSLLGPDKTALIFDTQKCELIWNSIRSKYENSLALQPCKLFDSIYFLEFGSYSVFFLLCFEKWDLNDVRTELPNPFSNPHSSLRNIRVIFLYSGSRKTNRANENTVRVVLTTCWRTIGRHR